ncbi:hydantoin racemase [Xylophilus sp. Kf1]|nr:hydantoin racemase [Xylophilus sp. Kf1]
MKLLLINPNLTQGVTDAVLAAARQRAAPGTELLAVTGVFGPAVIGSRAEAALAQHGLLDLAARHAPGCDAVVLGVSLDTALWACREMLDIPVVGMTEAGLLCGATVAGRIGLLTYGERMGPLYRELVASYGLSGRLAGVETLPLDPAASLADPEGTRRAVLEGALRLVRRDGAEAVLLAGAAMASMAEALQPSVPVPLLDGVGCAVAMAQALVGLRLPKATVGSLSATGPRELRGVSAALAGRMAGAR